MGKSLKEVQSESHFAALPDHFEDSWATLKGLEKGMKLCALYVF